MRDNQDTEPTHWHLDKKVPISIIVALFMQFLGGVWFMSRLEGRVVALEAGREGQEKVDDRQDRAAAAAIQSLHDQLDRIDGKLDRLIERPK